MDPVLVTVTVRRDDLEEAIEAMGYAHGDYCGSTCYCRGGEDRLQEVLDELDAADGA